MNLKQIKLQFAFSVKESGNVISEYLYVVSWNLVSGEIRKHFNIKESLGWRACTKEENTLLTLAYGKTLQDKLNNTIFERNW